MKSLGKGMVGRGNSTCGDLRQGRMWAWVEWKGEDKGEWRRTGMRGVRQEGPDMKGLTDQEHRREHELYVDGSGNSLMAFSIPYKIQPWAVQRVFLTQMEKSRIV